MERWSRVSVRGVRGGGGEMKRRGNERGRGKEWGRKGNGEMRRGGISGRRAK